MPLIPNPLYWMVGEWLVRNGAPLLRRTLVKTPPITDVLFEGEARLEHGPENIDGLLTVTTAALVFTPRGIRTRGAATSLPLVDIEEVAATKGRLFGLIPFWDNGLTVRTRRGIFRFRVERADRPAWLRELRAALVMAQPLARVPTEG